MYGQELNAESYAICKADMLIKGQDVANIIFGNTLSDDGLLGKQFDYMLSNPPFGVEWKKVEKEVRKEHEQQGFNGRFGPGLPRVSDGSLLFLLHLLSKMRPAEDGGSRFGIVLNGSPLFTGGAGSGESEIRRYVLENDLVEAIIGLPTDMFYNTGITTYVWIVSNRKPDASQGQGAADRRQRLLAEDAQEPGHQAQGTERRAHRRDHPPFGNVARKVDASDGVPDQPHLQERGFRLPHDHRRAPAARRGGQDRARRRRASRRASRSPTANLRDTENVPLQRGRGDLLQARGAAARAGRLDRPREDQGRLRNPVQPALLRVQAAAPAGRDRRRVEGRDGPDHDDDRGAGGMSFPRYPKYKDSGVEWLGEVPEHWEVTQALARSQTASKEVRTARRRRRRLEDVPYVNVTYLRITSRSSQPL